MLVKLDKARYDQHLMDREKRILRMSTPEDMLPMWLKSDPVAKAKVFSSPQDMWSAAQAYFSWATFNPVEEDTTTIFRGVKSTVTENRPRAFTMRAFATFCGVSLKAFEPYRNDESYKNVIDVIEQIIYTQKFEYAAVNIMNAGLIARDLDISEKIDLGGGRTPVRTIDVGKLSTPALEEILKAQDLGNDDQDS